MKLAGLRSVENAHDESIWAATWVSATDSRPALLLTAPSTRPWGSGALTSSPRRRRLARPRPWRRRRHRPPFRLPRRRRRLSRQLRPRLRRRLQRLRRLPRCPPPPRSGACSSTQK
uniref:Uncharacterized protein n=1 Tax=Ananas comosus var. bracteatus TaxID=296719 RepID=A0A6V7P972_ANACO|nr:unnamed protein product [Ananas comosus var. bracteatus]